MRPQSPCAPRFTPQHNAACQALKTQLAGFIVACLRPQIPCGRFSCLDLAGWLREKGHPMAGISEQQSGKEQAASATASNASRGDATYTASGAAASPIDDARFMRRAIELAWRGAGWTGASSAKAGMRAMGRRTPSATRLPIVRDAQEPAPKAAHPLASRSANQAEPLPPLTPLAAPRKELPHT